MDRLTKTCTRCRLIRPETDFYMRTAGYLAAECKTCSKARSAATRAGKIEQARAYDREYGRFKRGVIKEAVFDHYGDGKCACCGESEQLFLTLDHVNNDGAEDRRRIGGKQTSAGYITYRYLYRNGYPSGYQVLCANCQHGKRMNKGICPHAL